MKIEKKGNTVIAQLEEFEYALYDLYPEDLIQNDNPENISEKVKEIVGDILDMADIEDLEHHSIGVRVGVTENNEIVIELSFISKEMPTFEDFMKALLERIGELANPEEPEKDISSESERIIKFKSLSEIMNSVKYIKNIKESSVVKVKDAFYLVLSPTNTENFDNTACEFFSNVITDKKQIAYILEHSEVIIEKNAITTLSSI